MPSFSVVKSIQIAAPSDKVRAILTDYRQWPVWSPWLCSEPDCEISYQGDTGQPGHGYSWDGRVVGAGEMRLANTSSERLNMDLTFLKPWKSTAEVAFDLKAMDDDNTEVTWHMQSSLPFFMFFMTSTFTSMIGADYRRGLMMLKDYAENGSVNSSTDVNGVVEFAGCDYIGQSGSANIPDIGTALGDAFPRIEKFFNDSGIAAERVMSLYNKMNIRYQRCDYTAAITIQSDAGNVNNLDQAALSSSGLHTGQLSGGRALKVTHTGDYRHLGNAWSTAMMHLRTDKMKASKQQPPFEFYINDPATTEAENLITEIYLPLR